MDSLHDIKVNFKQQHSTNSLHLFGNSALNYAQARNGFLANDFAKSGSFATVAVEHPS
jgi:hypothetical protein